MKYTVDRRGIVQIARHMAARVTVTRDATTFARHTSTPEVDYGTDKVLQTLGILERVNGIEPSSTAWEVSGAQTPDVDHRENPRN